MKQEQRLAIIQRAVDFIDFMHPYEFETEKIEDSKTFIYGTIQSLDEIREMLETDWCETDKQDLEECSNLFEEMRLLWNQLNG